jgi:hypothetical protein
VTYKEHNYPATVGRDYNQQEGKGQNTAIKQDAVTNLCPAEDIPTVNGWRNNAKGFQRKKTILFPWLFVKFIRPKLCTTGWRDTT